MGPLGPISTSVSGRIPHCENLEIIGSSFERITNDMAGKFIIIALAGKKNYDLAGFCVSIDLAGKRNNDLLRKCENSSNYVKLLMTWPEKIYN